ncbi:hypothetical protein DSM100688_0649 [Bifidobacterium ramosum]|nr:hypothetical protein DSM100688_0649 [Bifidobacterium ramosum]
MFETVCSFNDRFGGSICLGMLDDGEVLSCLSLYAGRKAALPKTVYLLVVRV